MSVSLFQKIFIYHVAKRDSKGAYGSYLEEWHTGKDNRMAFTPSEFMSGLATSYSEKCEWKLSNTGCFQRLYTQILKQCNILDKKLKQYDDQVKVFQNEIREADSKIQTLQCELTHLSKIRDKAQKTGNLPPEASVSTVKELKMLMDKNELEIQKLDEEKKELRKKVQTIQNESNTNFSRESARLENLILSYQNRINHLHRDLMAFAKRQEERLAYYWHVLCEQLNKNSGLVVYEHSKSFPQICQSRGVRLMKKEDLFAKERAAINGRTSHYKNFSMKV